MTLQAAEGIVPGNGTADGGENEPAERRNNRRWWFPLRAAVLFACLLLAAAVTISLVQNREPHETLAVELDPDGESAERSAAEGSSFDPASLDRSGTGPATEEPPNPAGGAPSGERPGGLPGLSGSAGPDAAATGPEVVVHVAGAVAAPGIVRIPIGGRVADAVSAAGGALPEADLTMVNLAAPMDDGSMVVVPAVGGAGPAGGSEASGPFGPSGPSAPSGPGNIAGPGSGYTAGGAGVGAGGAAAGPVNLNTAMDAELQSLPRVGPVLAARIVAWRTDHGRFTRPEDLDAVPGIGEAMLAALLPLVTV
ncbi:ComEA family DNA-binding protein [Arthrobacter sp. Sa2CUA1]|uniref:ComEA family DNA-binding protein n=2 Tax=Arthrobacter gallicola TaxID=2762225 RepID=A0ABR8UNT7_9MICC|nr:ComEA family DNA-binding protein [Arthrobacter gallicola]